MGPLLPLPLLSNMTITWSASENLGHLSLKSIPHASYSPLCEPGPTPANNLPDDRISIAASALADTTGFLTTMFKIEVPIKMRVVAAATADNVAMASSQLV